MVSCMLDLETLGITPDCVVLSIGAVKFNPYSLDDPSNPWYAKLEIDEQLSLGRAIDQNTIDWWGKQSKAVVDEVMSDDDRITLSELVKQLNKFVVGADTIWAHGPVFDIVILENMYKMLGVPVPWTYGQIRDSRTIIKMGNSSNIRGRVEHNALGDAYSQAKAVQLIYKQYNITKE
jgi:hypothetical protein